MAGMKPGWTSLLRTLYASETEDRGSASVNQQGDDQRANRIAPLGEAVPGNDENPPVGPFPYGEDDLIGGESIVLNGDWEIN